MEGPPRDRALEFSKKRKTKRKGRRDGETVEEEEEYIRDETDTQTKEKTVFNNPMR